MGKRRPRSVTDQAALDRLVAKAKRNLAQGRSPRHGFTAAQAEALASRYSHYQDTRDQHGFLTDSALLLHRPDTPRPWLHLLCSAHDRETGIAGSFWDATGLGFLCYDSVLAGPVTSHKDSSYVPTSPRSTDVRQFFLREQPSRGPARIWHMLPQVGRQAEQYSGYSCRYGVGWVHIEAARNDLHARLRVFVPVDDPCELWTITLTNRSARQRKLQLFARVNWGLESHPAYYFDPRCTSLGDHLKDLRAIVALNRHQANALPRTGFMTSSAAFQGFDLSGEEFTGGGHFRAFPRAVEEGKCRHSLGLQPYLGLVGALQFDLALPARSSRTLHIMVGRTEREPDRYRRHLTELRQRFFSARGVEKEFARLQQCWRRMLGRVSLRSPDEEVDRLYNIWLKYQQHNTARFIRALDQIGYRDVLQDLMGICSFNPEYVRNHLPTVLNYQLADGRAIRQFFRYPNTNAPNDERMYADSPVWIADTLVSYLEETGDFDLPQQQVGFYDLATHRQDNRVRKSVYEHALLALQGLFARRGQRGLCLIGHGDWNDAMDGLSKRGEGVSTWVSVALVFASQRLLCLARHLNDQPAAQRLTNIIETMTRAVNEHAWDGDHYVFGFNDDGLAIGSQASEEGRLHTVTNTWTLFTGIAAAAGREEQVLRALLTRVWTPIGLATVDIPYTLKSRELAGRIADMVPGQFENGAVYTHGHSFLLYALAVMGRGDDLYQQLKLSLPGNTFPDIATGPPHQQSNFAVGPSHPNHGMNLYSNFTGSANWYLKTIDRMIGVLPELDGLRIKPTAPSAWREYELRKQFRGRDLHCRFHHTSGRSQVSSVSVDGQPIAPENEEFRIPLAALPLGRAIQVEVVL
jgi:cellobiose phosphorylase